MQRSCGNSCELMGDIHCTAILAGSETVKGPYQTLVPIGAGGMGEVNRAHDPRMQRDVAIKNFRRRFSDRFPLEVHVVAALNLSQNLPAPRRWRSAKKFGIMSRTIRRRIMVRLDNLTALSLFNPQNGEDRSGRGRPAQTRGLRASGFLRSHWRTRRNDLYRGQGPALFISFCLRR